MEGRYDVAYDDVTDTLPVCRTPIVVKFSSDRPFFTLLEKASVNVKEEIGGFRARKMMCY